MTTALRILLACLVCIPALPLRAEEDVKIAPEIIYRQAGLTRRFSSPYLGSQYEDTVDQLYGSITFSRTADYVHEVVLVPVIRHRRYNPLEYETDNLFEQAYVETQVIDGLLLTAGKKTIYDGSGMIVNPSDLLNEDKDLFDELYQREGKILTQAKYLHDSFALGVAFVPRRTRTWHAGKTLTTFSTDVIADIDLRLQHSYTDHDKSTVGLSLARFFFNGALELHTDNRYQRRERDPSNSSDKQLQYLNHNAYDRKEPNGYYLVGGRYILTPRRTIIVEAVTQQAGLLPEEFANMYAAFRDPGRTEEIPTRLYGRHYAFFSYQDDDLVEKLHLGATYLRNLDDGSQFVTLTGNYTFSDITAIEFTPTFFSGAEDTEFGEMPYSEAYYVSFKGKF